MQTYTQVLQRSSKRLELYLLVASGSLPEALKGLCNIVLFALQTTRHRSLGMTPNPAINHPSEAVLHPYPRLLVSIHECAV